MAAHLRHRSGAGRFLRKIRRWTRLDASRQMLSELVYARDVNTRRARRKGHFFRYGFVTSLAAGVAAIPVGLTS